MGCPVCTGQQTTEIEINLKGDEAVRFYSCRRCESKWWKRDGDTVALDDVLTLTAQREGR
jgi:hypothetical protein